MTESQVKERPGSDGAAEVPAPSGPAGPAMLSPRLRRAMAAILGGLVLVLAVALVVELFVLKPKYDAAQADQQARTNVVRVAQRFTAEVNNYDVASIDSYTKRIDPMLTTKFKGEFQQAMKDIVASVKQSKMTSRGQVLTSAVASVDPDSAQVLVVADAAVKTVFDTRKRHFRWQISLVKVDGRWLVDNFSPVA